MSRIPYSQDIVQCKQSPSRGGLPIAELKRIATSWGIDVKKKRKEQICEELVELWKRLAMEKKTVEEEKEEEQKEMEEVLQPEKALEKYTVFELRSLAKERGLMGISRLRKTLLIERLKETEFKKASSPPPKKEEIPSGRKEEPHIIRNYEVISELKRGFTAALYSVKDITTGVFYAMKIYFPGSKAEEFYQQELSAYHILSIEPDCSDLVVCLKEGFEEKISSRRTEYILVLEHMDGDLRDYYLKIERVGENPVRLIEFMKMLLEGLQFIHEKHVAHGDIKLGNILYKKEADSYILKYGDLGLTCNPSGYLKGYPASVPFSIRRCSSLAGTLRYLSPTQAQDLLMKKSRNLSLKEAQRNDVWALGVVFRLLATATWPFSFRSKDRTDILKTISEEEVEPSSYISENEILTTTINTVIDEMNRRDEKIRWTVEETLRLIRERTE